MRSAEFGVSDTLRLRQIARVYGLSGTAARWTLELTSGRTTSADVVVSAIGMFNEIAVPAISGLDSFVGTRVHSARWNRDHDLSGETVRVVGSQPHIRPLRLPLLWRSFEDRAQRRVG
jgi:cation diffusion facilitator CzcD-associated flavoprotein CzcO